MDSDPNERIWTIAETRDGGRTIRVWAATVEQIDQLNAWLGEPDVESLVSPEVMAEANALGDRAVHVFKEA